MSEKLPFIIGPYDLNRRIGRGGMGTVYGGIDRKNGAAVAVKVLAGRLSGEESFRQRFAKEIEALRQLNHPNIIQLLGYGQDDDTFFYSMELVDGNSLEEEIQQKKRRFTWQETLVVGLQIAAALRCAHDHGVIHRDLKPGNLLLSGTGVVKLSDFGIASLFGSTRLTDVGNVIGTIEYMSPEQATQQPVTPRSDLYSLGAVLVALMSGHPPFSGKSLLEIVHKHSTQQAKRPSQLGVRLPVEFDLLIGQLLNRDPEKRPKSALLVYRQMEEILRHAVSEQKSDAAPPESAGNGVAIMPGSVSSETRVPEREDEAVTPLDLNFGDKSRPEDFVGESSIWCKQFPQETQAKFPGDSSEIVRQCSALLEAAEKEVGRDNAAAEDGPGVLEAEDRDESRTIRFLAPSKSVQPGLGADADAVVAKNELNSENRNGERSVTHFVEVEKGEIPPQNSSLERLSDSPWVGLVLVLISSGCFLLIGFFLIKWWRSPPDAGVLYERITQAAKDESADHLQLREDIRLFVRYYSLNEHLWEVREIESRLELDQLERRLRSNSRGRDFSAVTPVERDYQNAIHNVRYRPEESLEKLEAFVTYYRSVYAHLPGYDAENSVHEKHRKKNKKQIQQYVELGQRQILWVKDELARETQEQRRELERQVEIALECLDDENDETRSFGEDLKKAILRLYGENLWAQNCIHPLINRENRANETEIPADMPGE